MSKLVKVLTGVAGLAAVVGFASPAAAQYYPNYGYGNNHSRGGVSVTIGGTFGGGQRYGYSPGYGYGQPYGYGQQYGNYGRGQHTQYAASQCSRAVQARLGGGYGYNSHGGGRVLGVTSVEQRNNGLRVRGIASSGQSGGYGYNNGGDLSFSCKVDYRGRITDLDLNRRSFGYGNGYNQGYNNGYYRGY